jgi:hypothetical protein
MFELTILTSEHKGGSHYANFNEMSFTGIISELSDSALKKIESDT